MRYHEGQVTILRLLTEHPEGLFANDIVKLADGAIGRFSVYDRLELLVSSGFVREQQKPNGKALPRTRHFITDSGRRALAEAETGGLEFGAA